mmetsp:Transcript_57215/g.159240  ORF Transcript_57215/g.159240 Transcript_57215/m.159240 type:complete len:310 (+) Transcript_57215:563-1492(+)
MKLRTSDISGHLSAPVDVQKDGACRDSRQKEPHEFHGHSLATGRPHAHRREGIAECSTERFQIERNECRHKNEPRDGVRLDEVAQLARVRAILHHHQRDAFAQACKHLMQMVGKCRRCPGQSDLPVRKRVGLPAPLETIVDASMRQDNALGLACGARRVQDDGRIVRADAPSVATARRPARPGATLNTQDDKWIAGYHYQFNRPLGGEYGLGASLACCISNSEPNLGIFHNCLRTLIWQFRRQWNIWIACFQHSDDRQSKWRPLGTHTHGRPGPGRETEISGRVKSNGCRGRVHLQEGHPPGFVDKGHL